MSLSSSTLNLFAAVLLAIAGAFGAAYALNHPDTLTRFGMSGFASKLAKAKAHPSKSNDVSTADAGSGRAADDEAGTLSLKANSNGHFETEAEVNHRRVEVMVDTGATLVALTYEDAERAGIFLSPADFTHYVDTANGRSKIALVEIESITIGDITVRNVRGAVSEQGKLSRTLLGMSFLGRLSRVDMRNKTLVLHE